MPQTAVTPLSIVAADAEPPNALMSLATEINREHLSALSAAQSAVEHARRCGDLLRHAKEQCGHGEWLPWLTARCPGVSERTAQRYMRLAEHWPELEAKASRVSDLPIRDALALLTESHPTPEPVPIGQRLLLTAAAPAEKERVSPAAIEAKRQEKTPSSTIEPTITLPPPPPSTYEWVQDQLTSLRIEQKRMLDRYAELASTAPKLTPAECRTVRGRLIEHRRGIDKVIVHFGGTRKAPPAPDDVREMARTAHDLQREVQ